MSKRYMVKVANDSCVREMFTNSFELATHAFDRIMRVARNTKLSADHVTVSVSAVSGTCFTHHYAECYRGQWRADKKYWNEEDWYEY